MPCLGSSVEEKGTQRTFRRNMKNGNKLFMLYHFFLKWKLSTNESTNEEQKKKRDEKQRNRKLFSTDQNARIKNTHTQNTPKKPGKKLWKMKPRKYEWRGQQRKIEAKKGSERTKSIQNITLFVNIVFFLALLFCYDFFSISIHRCITCELVVGAGVVYLFMFHHINCSVGKFHWKIVYNPKTYFFSLAQHSHFPLWCSKFNCILPPPMSKLCSFPQQTSTHQPQTWQASSEAV